MVHPSAWGLHPMKEGQTLSSYYFDGCWGLRFDEGDNQPGREDFVLVTFCDKGNSTNDLILKYWIQPDHIF